MSSFVSKGLLTALCAGGITLFGATAAHASDLPGAHHEPTGSPTTVSIPVTATGDSEAVLGSASRGAQRPTASPEPSSPGVVSISVPVRVADDPVAVLGSGRTGSPDRTEAAPTAHRRSAEEAERHRDRDHRAASPTRIATPITVEGNAVAVLGIAHTDPAARPSRSTPATARRSVIGVHAPIDLSGNALAVLGTALVPGGGDRAGTGAGGAPGSLLDASLPVTITGNAIAVLGSSTVESATARPTSPRPAPGNTEGASGAGSPTGAAPSGAAGGATGSTGRTVASGSSTGTADVAAARPGRGSSASPATGTAGSTWNGSAAAGPARVTPQALCTALTSSISSAALPPLGEGLALIAATLLGLGAGTVLRRRVLRA